MQEVLLCGKRVNEEGIRMSKFLRQEYQALTAYTPGEQPKDMAYIKLNTNESPYPPSEAVLSAVTSEEVENLRLYPDPTCKVLREALAESFGVTEENIFVSNGSDDILNFAFMAFAGHGGKAVFPEISYGFYKVFACLHGIQYKTIPLKDDFSIAPQHYFHQDGLVVIANPNAPTGLILSVEQVEEIVQNNQDNVVLIDEAYIDFGGESCVALTEKYENLLVVQTFSKSRSLAGARLGFAIGNQALIADLEKIKYSTNPYSINRLSLAIGTAAVKSSAYYLEKCKEIADVREYTKKALREREYTLTDSVANFIFVKKDGVSGDVIYQKLREKGILVRHFDTEKIKEYNRITIGTKEQMDALICALDAINQEGETK